MNSNAMNMGRTMAATPVGRGADKTSALLKLPVAFTIGFFFIYAKSFIGMTPLVSIPDALDKILLFIGALLLSFHIVLHIDQYGKRLIPLCLVLVACAYSYVRSGETAPITVSLVVISAATVGDIKAFVRLWFNATLFFTLFLVGVFILTAVFDPENLSRTISLRGDGLVVRYAFSFYHPNMAAAIVMMLCGVYMYLHYSFLNARTYAGVIAIAVVMLFVTGSRTSFILTLIEVLLFYRQRKRNMLDQRWLRSLIAVLPVFIFLGVLLVSGPLYTTSLGELFTGRVTLWYRCFLNQGVSLFGQPFEATAYTTLAGWTYYYTTLDCAYASGLFVLGLAFSAFFCWCIYTRVKRADASLSAELPLIIVMLIFGITEVHVFNVVICAPLLLISGGVLPQKRSIGCVQKAPIHTRRLFIQRRRKDAR